MNRHTMENMLHDPTTHDAVRRMELLVVVVAAIVVLYGILYHTAF